MEYGQDGLETIYSERGTLEPPRNKPEVPVPNGLDLLPGIKILMYFLFCLTPTGQAEKRELKGPYFLLSTLHSTIYPTVISRSQRRRAGEAKDHSGQWSPISWQSIKFHATVFRKLKKLAPFLSMNPHHTQPLDCPHLTQVHFFPFACGQLTFLPS